MAQRRPKVRNPNTVALLGSYLPRQCGIATFTKDLRDALVAELSPECTRVVAMDDVTSGYAYPAEVHFQVYAQRQADYRLAGDFLNINQIDVVLVQHEFGIYGGSDGALLLNMLRRLRMPIIATLHTVLTEPTESQGKIIRELGQLCDRLVVMTHRAETILQEVYGLPAEKIAFIPHGIPDVPFVDPSFHKDRYGVEGRTVLLTFGLLSPAKGIEVALAALPQVVERHPEVIYVILGATHPHVLQRDGEAYRNALQRQVDQLGLRDQVLFQNRFVSLEELCRYIGAADAYLTPYLNPAQITSGTLAYALGAGKAIVSTPYWYAEEMLADGRGCLVPFQDADALAEQVNYLLDHEVERHAMRKRAYLHCRPMVWKKVAQQYLRIIRAVLRERQRSPHPVTLRREPPVDLTDTIPEIDLRHLVTLTDDTGILQHATYTIPDRRHGYTTDDNARALVASLMYHELRRDDRVLGLATTYLSFLRDAFNAETGRFRNVLSFDRRWLEDDGHEDVHGRALWGLGLAAALAFNEGMAAFATRLFSDGLRLAESFGSPRAWAFTLVGLHAYLRRFGGDARARRIRKVLAEKLCTWFQALARPEWPWGEEALTYDNAKLPHALILAGQWLPDEPMLRQGLQSLEWLLDAQSNSNGQLSLIGNQGWMTRAGHRARFDQQPIEVMALAEACAEAFRATQDQRWLGEIQRCLGWFLGLNDCQAALYDFKTGGCRDGLQPDGPNQNEGAESTLAWLISLITAHSLLVEKEEIAT
jgi:glycosyltransferase involved in cell wall biosynthesis